MEVFHFKDNRLCCERWLSFSMYLCSEFSAFLRSFVHNKITKSMKKLHFPVKAAITLLLLICGTTAYAQSVSKSKAAKWTKQREWANGFAPTPDKTTDYTEFYTQYHKNKELWDKAFTWLATHDLVNMPAGKQEIEGKRLTVSVENGTTQEPSKRRIEAHRNYIDLQYVARGTERFGLINPKDATPINEYKPDVQHFTSDKIKYVDSNPDIFFMFFPRNYHQAMVQAGAEGEQVRVIVLKIEYVQ